MAETTYDDKVVNSLIDKVLELDYDQTAIEVFDKFVKRLDNDVIIDNKTIF